MLALQPRKVKGVCQSRRKTKKCPDVKKSFALMQFIKKNRWRIHRIGEFRMDQPCPVFLWGKKLPSFDGIFLWIVKAIWQSKLLRHPPPCLPGIFSLKSSYQWASRIGSLTAIWKNKWINMRLSEQLELIRFLSFSPENSTRVDNSGAICLSSMSHFEIHVGVHVTSQHMER